MNWSVQTLDRHRCLIYGEVRMTNDTSLGTPVPDDEPWSDGHKQCGECGWCLKYKEFHPCELCTCPICWRIGTDL